MPMTERDRVTLMERYRDIMLEIKERTLSIGPVVNGNTGLHGPLAREFCFLQLRMICECIALSCLIAHGDIGRIRSPKYQRATSADLLMKLLEQLHADFYPHPVRLTITPGHTQVDDVTEGFLTKAQLIRLVRYCGGKVHRGPIQKYTFTSTPQQLKAAFTDIMKWANQILRLLEQHKINFSSGNEYIFCLLSYGPDARVHVFWGGPQSSTD
jgi:hypothetical protein